MILKELTLQQFCEETSKDVAVPGGGSVAALSASLGASLAEMVGHMTQRKADKNGMPLDSEVAEGIKKAAQAKVRFQQLIDEDAKSFDFVMAAFSLPKNTDEEKTIRKTAVQKAYLGATCPPLEVATLAAEVLPFAVAMLKKGDPNALSDAAVGIRMLHAGIFGAVYNVRINISALTDADEAGKLSAKVNEIESFANKTVNEALKDLSF